MHNIQIDKSHCVKCGQCVITCPGRLFSQENSQEFPKTIPNASELCIGCNHCVAACPVGVIAIDEIDQAACQPISKEGIPRFEHISTLVRMRRSIRNYSDRPLEQSKLEQIFDVIRWAPSAKNGLPVRWIVVNSRKAVNEIASLVIDWMRPQESCRSLLEAWDGGVDPITRGAPCLAIAYTGEDAMWPVVDATIAVETLDLCLAAMRLGSCWAGYFVRAAQNDKKIPEHLGLDATQKIQGALFLGYPGNEAYQRVPFRKELDIRWIQ